MAILDLICGAISLITICAFYGLYYDDLQNILGNNGPAYNRGQLAQVNSFIANYINAWFAIAFIIYVIWILFAALLFLGIQRKNHCLMLPFLIVDMIGLVVSKSVFLS